jgi:hypothetical protein
MSSIGFFLAYIFLIVSLVTLAFILAVRFVKAHERGAAALEETARQLARVNWKAGPGA